MTPAEEIEIVGGATGRQAITSFSQISPDDFAAAATVIAAEPSG